MAHKLAGAAKPIKINDVGSGTVEIGGAIDAPLLANWVIKFWMSKLLNVPSPLTSTSAFNVRQRQA